MLIQIFGVEGIVVELIIKIICRTAIDSVVKGFLDRLPCQKDVAVRIFSRKVPGHPDICAALCVGWLIRHRPFFGDYIVVVFQPGFNILIIIILALHMGGDPEIDLALSRASANGIGTAVTA